MATQLEGCVDRFPNLIQYNLVSIFDHSQRHNKRCKEIFQQQRFGSEQPIMCDLILFTDYKIETTLVG